MVSVNISDSTEIQRILEVTVPLLTFNLFQPFYSLFRFREAVSINIYNEVSNLTLTLILKKNRFLYGISSQGRKSDKNAVSYKLSQISRNCPFLPS